MARTGQFAGASEQYAQPLSYIHPPDNDFSKSRYADQLNDPKLHLTEEQKRRLQEEIDQLLALQQEIDQLPGF